MMISEYYGIALIRRGSVVGRGSNRMGRVDWSCFWLSGIVRELPFRAQLVKLVNKA